MLALVLAVVCGLAIGMIFKWAGQRSMDRLVLLTVNYVTAFLVALGFAGAGGGLSRISDVTESGVVWLGVVQGALFIFGFFILALATEIAGMSLAVGVMRVSVVIPFLASWVLWDEVPTAGQGIGLVLAGIAFFMIARRPASDGGGSTHSAGVRCKAGEVARWWGRVRSSSPPHHPATSPPFQGITRSENQYKAPRSEGAHGSAGSAFAVLAVLFFAGGATDVGMKVFDEVFAAAYSRRTFLMIVFGIAALLGIGIVALRTMRGQARYGAAVWGWGVLLGLVNFGSAEFLLQAIRRLSGTFVFPANNIALVMGAALLGVWIWGERLSVLNWAGLALAGVALFLLTV